MMKLFFVLLLAALPLESRSISAADFYFDAEFDEECAANADSCSSYGLAVKQMPKVDRVIELAEAIQENYSNLLRCAISAGVSPNLRFALDGDKTTPLVVHAAVAGSVQSLEVLIDAGADLAATDWEGDTALMNAAALGQAGSVRSLLAAGADVNAQVALQQPEREFRAVLGSLVVQESLATGFIFCCG